MSSFRYETTYQKFLPFIKRPEKKSNNKKKITKQKIFMSQGEELKEKQLMSKQNKEEIRIEIPTDQLTKQINVDESEKDSKIEDKSLNKGKIQEKATNIEIEDDSSTTQIFDDYFTTENINRYEGFIKKKMKKYNLDLMDGNEENEFGIKKKKLDFRNEEILRSNLSETFRKEMPTKIKLYKCVIWRNIAPGVNEDTIKHILHRSGSQGGFVKKLAKNPALKSSKKSNENK